MRTAKTILIFTVLILSYSANCQFFENSIIKTRPFQDFVGFNPNIGIEKPVSEKISTEFELMYRNRTWYSNGGEWDFGKFHPSTGVRILGGIRKYMGKEKVAPFGWFFGMQITISYCRFNEMKMSGFHNEYINTQKIDLLWPEIIPFIGNQFHLSNRISFEVYIGPSLYLFCDKRTEIIDSLDPNEIGTIEHNTYPFGEYGRLAFSWTIGYLLK